MKKYTFIDGQEPPAYDKPARYPHLGTFIEDFKAQGPQKVCLMATK